jgi:hypothetical protein
LGLTDMESGLERRDKPAWRSEMKVLYIGRSSDPRWP